MTQLGHTTLLPAPCIPPNNTEQKPQEEGMTLLQLADRVAEASAGGPPLGAREAAYRQVWFCFTYFTRNLHGTI